MERVARIHIQRTYPEGFSFRLYDAQDVVIKYENFWTIGTETTHVANRSAQLDVIAHFAGNRSVTINVLNEEDEYDILIG